MSSPFTFITPEAARSIAAAIRAGVYPHVASEAVGVSRELFDEAMRLGTQSGTPSEAQAFAAQIRQAIAQARMKAEMLMLAQDAGFWLKHGPGKGSESNPGWTNPVKPVLNEDTNASVVASAELLELGAEILKALEPFAEARTAVVKVLVQAGLPGERDA
jgi:hypothetical protein